MPFAKKPLLPAMLALTLLVAPATAQRQGPPGAQPAPSAPFNNRTQEMTAFPGFFNYYWDDKTGKIWLEVDNTGEEFLYIHSLSAGIGSNDIGLDRGQLGGSHVVYFEKAGNKLLLMEPNYGFRAGSGNPDERLSVETAFARSVHWGFDISEEENGRYLVDATAFFLQDAHNVAGRLRQAGQGQYRLELPRSAIYLPMCKNFPKNTEVEATLTFMGEPAGAYIRSVSPTASAVTVRQHHSFVELPEPGYVPRQADPRAGYFTVSFLDFASPVTEPIKTQYITRHRLNKKDPSAALGEPVKPIVYYVDRGAPEPVRSALLDGAKWWNQAFEAAGFLNAFKVEMMPEGADPMDVRYNVIQWVHRSTRGWSYGASVRDPRTGEIIKGHVTLGSLRVRQDFLIAAALQKDTYKNGEAGVVNARELALARIRQLSAHEIGHTLGLAHNYAASADSLASVMDYPHPHVSLGPGGTVDIANAYDGKIGTWDKLAIDYGYREFPEGADEQAGLRKILAGAQEKGLRYITDADARPTGSAHPTAHLWDNGPDAVDEMERLLDVRKAALANLSAFSVPEGAPLATLEEALVPVYLLHRYQAEAAAKVLGGLDYTYATRGDGQQPLAAVPAQAQWRAFNSLLKTLSPETLAVPAHILALIPPRPPGFPRSRETFRGSTGLTFDPLAAAGAAANMTLSLILHPERAARLVNHHALDNSQPQLAEVLDRLLAATFKARHANSYQQEIQRTVNAATAYRLMDLAQDKKAPAQVRAVTLAQLNQLRTWLETAAATEKDNAQKAHFQYFAAEIKAFGQNPGKLDLPPASEMPDGPPIGTVEMCTGGFGPED